jgi:ribosomal protein S1
LTAMTVQRHDMKPKWWQTLLKGDYLSKRPRRGDICEATILSIGEHDILVELAGKRDGLIQREDLAEVDDAYLAKLEVGDRIPVRIVRVPYDRSAILVSLKQGLKQQEWMRVKVLQENQEIIVASFPTHTLSQCHVVCAVKSGRRRKWP